MAAPPGTVVGPNFQGNLDEYVLVRRLQKAVYGGLYEAEGVRSKRSFAIKALRKQSPDKEQHNEIRFAEILCGHPNVMPVVEHFEDAYFAYVVYELARGGDLLEALTDQPDGFDEAHTRSLVKQIVQGVAFLHEERHMAMQDVSLENTLLTVQETTGNYQVKIGDPGQAVIFDVDESGDELPVKHLGLVGKNFRPPEIYSADKYLATKVDCWCIGWSTFYLQHGRPLFMSADPAEQDPDWQSFQQNVFSFLQLKGTGCSPMGRDFILRLMQLDPSQRMSARDALLHPWLEDSLIAPVLAPEHLILCTMKDSERERERKRDSHIKNGSIPVVRPDLSSKDELPAWASAKISALVTQVSELQAQIKKIAAPNEVREEKMRMPSCKVLPSVSGNSIITDGRTIRGYRRVPSTSALGNSVTVRSLSSPRVRPLSLSHVSQTSAQNSLSHVSQTGGQSTLSHVSQTGAQTALSHVSQTGAQSALSHVSLIGAQSALSFRRVSPEVVRRPSESPCRSLRDGMHNSSAGIGIRSPSTLTPRLMSSSSVTQVQSQRTGLHSGTQQSDQSSGTRFPHSNTPLGAVGTPSKAGSYNLPMQQSPRTSLQGIRSSSVTSSDKVRIQQSPLRPSRSGYRHIGQAPNITSPYALARPGISESARLHSASASTLSPRILRPVQLACQP